MVIYSGFSHEKWWFSIAMLNYQRVDHVRSLKISAASIWCVEDLKRWWLGVGCPGTADPQKLVIPQSPANLWFSRAFLLSNSLQRIAGWVWISIVSMKKCHYWWLSNSPTVGGTTLGTSHPNVWGFKFHGPTTSPSSQRPPKTSHRNRAHRAVTGRCARPDPPWYTPRHKWKDHLSIPRWWIEVN